VKRKIQSRTVWILVRVQIVIANLDPEVLQWPGGTLIAPLLWFQVMARPFWAFGKGGKAAPRNHTRCPKASYRPTPNGSISV
jgi:hypothetical protein